jgi:DHA2 family multidrug resistance protein
MADRQPASHPHVNPWIIAISVMFSTIMEVLDTTVVNVSLPHIAGNLSATIEESAWALTSYLVANAIILPITGWLASYMGRKRLLMAAVVGFTAASFLCGLAPSLRMLIICRVLQGLSGGVLQPISQAVLLESFAPEDRGKAMGFWGMGIIVAPIFGPVIGGWLTDNYSWRWVFYINIPVGIASIIMTKLFIFDPPYLRRKNAGIDYWGIGLLTLGIAALQIMLDKGQEEDWFGSTLIVALAIMAAITLAAFVWREMTCRDPVVHLQLFTMRTYSTGVFLATSLGFVLYGSMVLLPVMLQTLLGFSAQQAGIAMAPRGVGVAIAMLIVGSLIGKVGPRKMLALGLALAAFTMFWYGALNAEIGFWDICWPQVIQGFAFGLIFVPLTTISMDPIPRQEMGFATSLYSLMRNTGGSIGIAAASTLLARSGHKYANLLGAHVNQYDPGANALIGGIRSGLIAGGANSFVAARQAQAALYGMLQRQATMLSFLEAYRLLGLFFALLIPLVLIMKNPRTRGRTVSIAE